MGESVRVDQVRQISGQCHGAVAYVHDAVDSTGQVVEDFVQSDPRWIHQQRMEVVHVDGGGSIGMGVVSNGGTIVGLVLDPSFLATTNHTPSIIVVPPLYPYPVLSPQPSLVLAPSSVLLYMATNLRP